MTFAAKTRDRLFVTGVWAAALTVCAAFCVVVGDIAALGIGELSWGFLALSPEDAGRGGGILPIFVSSLLILAVALASAVPLGIAAAAYLAEFAPTGRHWTRFVRRSLDVLAGMPSIVFGLFGSALFCKVLGLGFSILSGGLTLACMILPILIRTFEESFRMVSFERRAGAAALGLDRFAVFWRITLPESQHGIAAGLVLAIGRSMAETAALVFTSGYVDRMPESLFDSGRALSIHVYDLSTNVPGGDARAAASAFVLLGTLLCITSLARHLAMRNSTALDRS